MSATVLYVNTPTYIGGAEISLLTLMRNLDPKRYRPSLVTGLRSSLAEVAHQYAIDVSSRDFPLFRMRYPWRYPASIVDLANNIRQGHVAVIHTNCDRGLNYVMHAARLARRPYISHVRDFTRGWYQSPAINALMQAQYVIANSQAVADRCLEAGISEEKMRVIYNPFDLNKFTQQQVETARQQLALATDDFAVGIVGQILPMKGHDDLVQAAGIVFEQFPKARFLVVGEAVGEESQAFKNNLQRRLQAKGLDRRFTFLGFRSDIERVLSALDVLVVPSWSEPFGRVVVEGLATGCAVVGTNVGGIPEIITDGVNGLLVPPHDPSTLAQAIVRIATEPLLRSRLHRNGPPSVVQFDVRHHVDRVCSLYDAVISMRG
jgi:glycosyltransferase involved in cell wall biosynthesis